MIALRDVSKSFNTGQPNQYLALDRISLDIGRNELTVLKGPSGSGKTTLLTLIGCMSRPTSGRILLYGMETGLSTANPEEAGLDISSLPERFLTEIRRRRFGFIFQQFNLLRRVTVLENVMLPTYPGGESHRQCRQRALELLATFGIERHAASMTEWLSGGEMQRVAIARALINDPEVIIADEPTAHLDSKLAAEFMDLVGSFKQAGKSIIIASHDPLVYNHPLTDRIVAMRDGKVVEGQTG